MQILKKKLVEQSKFSMSKTSRICNKIIPDYAIPYISSGNDSDSRIVNRKILQDVIREIPIYPDPLNRPPPKPVKLSIPKIPRGLSNIDQKLIWILKKTHHFKRVSS